MSGLATWDKINGSLGSTDSAFGGDWGNLISDYLNGINVGLSDPTKQPKPNTLTRYRFEKLAMFDGDESHWIVFSPDDIDTGGTRKIKIRRMNSPNEEDYMLMEGLPATILNKNLSGSSNTFTNIPKSAIPFTTVYTDQNNIFGNFTQDFPSGWMRIKAGSSFVSLGSNTQTGSFSFIIPTLTANDFPAMLALTNIFTTFQKIQYSSTAALTLYRPDNTVSNGTGIAFNLRNFANSEVSYAAIYAVNNQNTTGSELGSLAFYVRNAASFIDRMLLTSDNKLRIGLAASGIIFDPTGISGSSKNFTLPNLSGEVQTLNAPQEPISKTIDSRKNTLLRLNRYGAYRPTEEIGPKGEGCLAGLVGLGTYGGQTTNPGGKYEAWNTKTVVDDCAGVVKLDTYVFWRNSNPLIRFAWLASPISSVRRVFKGFGPKRLINVNSDTAPVNTGEFGFFFGYGAGDTQWQIFHNDATGTCVKETTGINIPAIFTNYILEIQGDDNVGSWTWTLYSVTSTSSTGIGVRNTILGTGTITSRIPGSLTSVYLQDLVATVDGSVQSDNIHYIEVFT